MLDRRAFLGVAAATASSFALAGCVGGDVEPTVSSEETAEAPATQTSGLVLEGGEWKTLCCWQSCGGRCLNKGYVVDGVIVRQKTDDTHEDSQEYPQQRSCLKGKTLSTTWLGEDRIKYPMKRKNWQPGGADVHPELRGKDEWERISWDEAIEMIASEVKRVFADYGSRSLLGVSWDGIPYASYLGGCINIMATGSQGTARLAPAHLGATYSGGNVKRGQSNDRFDMMYNSENIVLYSINPAWSAMGSPMWHFMEAKNNGATFTSVGPTYNQSASMLEADWIQVRPGTDTAFLLAVAYEMVRLDEEGENLIDWDFLHTYTVGFDAESMPEDAKSDENFLGYIKGEYDDTPKTPEWASKICGTPVEDITKFARLLSKDNKVMTFNSFACMRYLGTENLEQLMITVNSMGGHYGKSGHGWGGYYFDGGADAPCNLILTGDNGEAAAKEANGISPKNPLGEPIDDVISAAQVWDAILEGTYHFTGDIRNDAEESGCEDRELDVRFMDFGTWSAMRAYPDTTKAVRALREGPIECVVGRGIVPKVDIQYCDIVLPIISDLEQERLLETGEGGREIVYHYDKVCDPIYEARSNAEFESALLEALGEDPLGMYPLSANQKLYNQMAGTQVICEDGETYENLLTITQQDIDDWGVEGKPQEGRITLSEFREAGVYQVQRSKDDNYGFIAYKDFVDDPKKNPLDSPSGKFEIYCQYKADLLNKAHLSDDEWKPYPHYVVPKEGYETTFDDFEGEVKGEFPYQLYNPHFPRFGNGVYGNVKSLAEAFVTPVFVGTDVAEECGIENGDTVLVESRYGKVLRRASVTPLMMPGVVSIPNGSWSQFDDDMVDVMGGVSTLSGSYMQGLGPTAFNSNNVRITKWDGEELSSDADHQVIISVE